VARLVVSRAIFSWEILKMPVKEGVRERRWSFCPPITERVKQMADEPSEAPAKSESSRSLGERHLLSNLRREFDRLFEDFYFGPWRSSVGHNVFDVEPFWRGELTFGKAPAVDIAERDNEYEITAELPGMAEEDIDVKYADGVLSIKGEKKEEKEEKHKDYYLSERPFGSFQRSFQSTKRHWSR
jgi:HSP20 family protein